MNLEQLTLFELEAEPIPTFYWEPAGIELNGSAQRRRRRKAWLPRLVRWFKAQVCPHPRSGLRDELADRRSSAFTPETRGNAGPRIG